MDQSTHRLRCACGWEAAGTLDALVEAATEHGRRIHNMTPTRDEVMAMVLDDATDESDHGTKPSDPAEPRA